VFTTETQSSQRGTAATELAAHEVANRRVDEWASMSSAVN
jgi:hypothetical protein